MSNLRAIRTRLGMTQSVMAAELGCTKAMVSLYERGRPVLPVAAAGKLIAAARSRGVEISYDDIYRVVTATPAAQAA